MASDVTRIGFKDDPAGIKPTVVINDLLAHLPDIDEIYVVVKTKEGDFVTSCSGNAGGVAFSIQVLTKYMADLL